ncbi:MAG TPA: hypothetical protein VLX44_08395 [Xanthobacteraceae bacterium]|nr:hypothetical protein [Xanthobacteraceae bacterium]
MRAIDPIKAGLVLGILMGAFHLGWALLVATGSAQAVVDFVLWMHFIKPIYLIAPFAIGTAAVLVAVTTATGFVFGFLFALLWNNFHRI